jgi:DNA-binding Xre family transcriptional regulator|tara:strand:- start:47 stop:355 length:309 start_codon:yes stop_codon:yes gene_type:complete
MMSDGNISLPQWTLPIGAAAVSLAVAWGVLQSNVAHATEDRERIQAIAEESLKKAQDNGQAQAVTAARLDAIVSSLEKQEEISAKTSEQISVLVQALLKQQN